MSSTRKTHIAPAYSWLPVVVDTGVAVAMAVRHVAADTGVATAAAAEAVQCIEPAAAVAAVAYTGPAEAASEAAGDAEAAGAAVSGLVASGSAKSPEPYTVHSTINASLQHEAKAALQEGLARYEIDTGPVKFREPEANIGDAIQKFSASGGAAAAPGALPVWQQALQALKLPLADVHWEPAVILDKDVSTSGDRNIRVGIRDGRVFTAQRGERGVKRNLGLYDVVYVRVIEGKTVANRKTAGSAPGATVTIGSRAELRVRPTVQGAALVLENKNRTHPGNGGQLLLFHEPAEPDCANPASPGSAMKPLTYGRAAIGTATQHARLRRPESSVVHIRLASQASSRHALGVTG